MNTDKFLPGITVLAERTVRDASIAHVLIAVVLVAMIWVLIGSILKQYFSSKSTEERSTKNIGRIVLLIMIVLITLAICIDIIHGYTIERKEYEIVADDTVGINEFFDNYEIVNHDGNTYTVRIRSKNREGQRYGS